MHVYTYCQIVLQQGCSSLFCPWWHVRAGREAWVGSPALCLAGGLPIPLLLDVHSHLKTPVLQTLFCTTVCIVAWRYRWNPGSTHKTGTWDPDAGEDWGQEQKRGWQRMRWLHHWLKEHEQTPGDGEGQGSLECCRSWGHDLATEQQAHGE